MKKVQILVLLNMFFFNVLLSQSNMPYMDTEEVKGFQILKSGIKINFINVSEERAFELSQEKATLLLDQPEFDIAIYKLADNRILTLVEGFGGSIYSNINDYNAVELDNKTSFEDINTIRFFVDEHGNKIHYNQEVDTDNAELISKSEKVEIKDRAFRRHELYKAVDGKYYFIKSGKQGRKVFEKLEDVFEYMIQQKSSWLRGINTFGSDFHEETQGLIKKLKTILGIETLDFSVESLSEVDSFVDKNVVDDELFYEIYLPIVTYIGEVYIENVGGKWDYEISGDIWEPVIITPSGKTIYFYHDIYESLHPNSTEVFSLYFTYDKYINPIFSSE